MAIAIKYNGGLLMIETTVVCFPALNKNDWLQTNDLEIMRATSVAECEVVKVVELTPEEYDDIAGSLLTSREELWEGIGGTKSYHPDLNGVGWLEVVNDPALMLLYRSTSAVQVVKVECTDSVNRLPFYVNTEGHTYARYVGRACYPEYTGEHGS